MKRKAYIKNLDFNEFNNFNNKFITCCYDRNGECNKITFRVKKNFIVNEKNVRNLINN
jgi:hypothetical protein